jgi:membrane fusion protein (multidrug efflux system)
VTRRALLVALGLLALAGAAWAVVAWEQAGRRVSTDDAYVEATVAPVSAQVPGRVVDVLVRDNQAVAAGEVVARLDPRDYRARLEQARAAVAIAERRQQAAAARVALARQMAASQGTQSRAAALRAEAARESAASLVESSRAAVRARQAALASAHAERDRLQALYERAVSDLARARELAARELVPRQFVEHAEVEARAAAAQLAAAAERVAQARRDLEAAEADARMREAGFEPQQIGLRTAEARAVEARAQQEQAAALAEEVRVRQAEHDLARAQLEAARADLALAALNLEHTAIRAPIAGLVTRKSVEVGQVVQPGQPLLAVVSLTDVWVVANFKETQLGRLRPGLPAEVRVDTFPGRRWTGQVESIAAGTGARFSLLPPENATGNWVKVVQRIPVRIALAPGDAGNPHVLRAGMSAVVTVHLR